MRNQAKFGLWWWCCCVAACTNGSGGTTGIASFGGSVTGDVEGSDVGDPDGSSGPGSGATASGTASATTAAPGESTGGASGTDTASGETAPGDTDDPSPDGWLYTEGNHIYAPDGSVWHGRGANLHDTRSCDACTFFEPDVGEVLRRVDELVDVWGANFIRLDLESYSDGGGRLHWQSIHDDPAYLADLHTIVDHIATKPGVYVLMSLWIDPGHSEMGWPTAATQDTWRLLASEFADQPRALFGLVNEPEYNFDGALDPEVWQAMDDTVAAIREVEDQLGTPHHVVTVQGTGGWARRLDYYVTHPITAGGGDNVAYEVHVYDPASTFQSGWVEPAATLPVVIGEFGDAEGYMTLDDVAALFDEAESLEIPYLAWTFHMRCSPNLLVDHSGGACGEGMPLEPTTFGTVLQDRLAQPY